MTGRLRETCQIVVAGSYEVGQLAIHEWQMGTPRCGTTPRPWRGNRMVVQYRGPGTVTCKRCIALGRRY